MFPIPSYSHSGEDRLIWKLFGYRQSGVYVDVGCYHPTDYSNTYLLYRTGWSGLVIDADSQFLTLYAQTRPNDRVAHCAVAARAADASLYVFEDRSINTLDETTAQRYVADGKRMLGSVPVQARPLAAVLRDHGMAQVDFLNIDIEGLDIEALSSLDWQRTRPAIVAVEDHAIRLDTPTASSTYNFMREQGYILHSKVNYTSVYQAQTIGSI